MKILNNLKDELTRKIILTFEEGEELNTVLKQCKILECREIDAIYGHHLATFLDVGQVSADTEPVMAASAWVEMLC